MMKFTVLTDNLTSLPRLRAEWGLSVFIEYEGHSYLLDTGQSDAFISNASELGINLADVGCAVISHAHYDHSLGLGAFFRINSVAKVYISPDAAENCYAGWRFISKYIGLPRGLRASCPDRFVAERGVVAIADGVWLVPHSTGGLGALGKRNHLYVKHGLRYLPDDFSHEQSLVFRTGEGLVIFNSCSHSGPDVIVDEVRRAFPGENIAAYVGGLHLFRLNDAEIRRVADNFAACGISRIYAGHCTGKRAFEILKERFGDSISQFRCGMEVEFD